MSIGAGAGGLKTDVMDVKDGGAKPTLIVKLKHKPILKVFFP
jgi:hypothetical protein